MENKYKIHTLIEILHRRYHHPDPAAPVRIPQRPLSAVHLRRLASGSALKRLAPWVGWVSRHLALAGHVRQV